MRVSFESILPLRIILFIEIHSANTKTEDREEIYPRSILFHFTNVGEFLLFINPVAIGNGMTIFKDLNEIQKYTLIESKAFECGIVLLRYEA